MSRKLFKDLGLSLDNIYDLDAMKIHMLDCAAALKFAQKKSQQKSQTDASNELFKDVLGMILGHPKQFNGNSNIRLYEELMFAFPDKAKQKDGRSWLPLHWSVLILGVTGNIKNVKRTLNEDPDALYRYHLKDAVINGYTPVHLLCMQVMSPFILLSI